MSEPVSLDDALRAQKAGDRQRAAILYQRLLRSQPGHPQATLHYALLQTGEGHHHAALSLLEPLSERYPDVPAVSINLGEVLRRLDRYDDAVTVLQSVVSQVPDMPAARFNLALALRGAGRPEDALIHYAAGLRQQPEHGDGWYNQGNAQQEVGLNEEAQTSYQRALTLVSPARRPSVLNNLGSVRLLQRKPVDAENALREAVALAPEYPDGHLNLAIARERLGRFEDAADGYRKTAKLNPEHWWHALRADCLCPDVFSDSAAIDQWRDGFAATIERWRLNPSRQPDQLAPEWLHHSGIEAPPSIMYQGRDDRALKSAYADMLAPRLPVYEPPRARTGMDRPRIGFVVSHGHEDIFARSVLGVLQRLDRRRFEIVIAVTRPALRRAQYLLPVAELEWLPLSQRVDEAAGQLRTARLDVLYHWEVGSDSFNYFLPWFRPAPIQYTSWAWPITTGIPGMDYFLSSDLVEPPDGASLYSETLLTMPGNMFTWAEPPTLPKRPPDRSEFGLSEQAHLYLCHQNPRKIHPDFDPLIAAILQQDPAGRLVLIGSPEGTETAPLRHRLQQRLGPLADRVHILARMPRDRYLSLLNLVDVALDPPHYTGANTSFDALGLGVPIITMASPLLRGNFTSGLYRQMGLDDLITDDPARYVNLALNIAKDPSLRAHWHETLMTHKTHIFRTAKAVSELESAWTYMLEMQSREGPDLLPNSRQ